jgi:hypothetical protein
VQLADEPTIEFLAVPDAVNSMVFANPVTLYADGVTFSTITVRLRDAADDFISGVTAAEFSLDVTDTAFTSAIEELAGNAGTYTLTVTSTTVGPIVFKVTARGTLLDAQPTVEAFAERLRDEVDLTALVGDLRGSAAAALQPRHVSVWLVSAGQTSPGGAR